MPIGRIEASLTVSERFHHLIARSEEEMLTSVARWALPVRVDALDAKLQTHVDTLPALTLVRLFLQFGHTRPNAKVKPIPAELVKQILGYMVALICERNIKEWSAAIRCWENTCDIRDHANDNEIVKENKTYLYDESYGPCPTSFEEMLSHLSGSAVSSSELGQKALLRHYQNKRQWLKKIDHIFHPERRSIFQKRFGLDIWVSESRIHPSRQRMHFQRRVFRIATSNYYILYVAGKSHEYRMGQDFNESAS